MIQNLKITSLGMLFILTACASSQPIIQVERVNVPTYVPISSTLTAPVQVSLLPRTTYGEALGRLREGLISCDSQLQAIQGLTAPKPPINP